MKAEGNRKFCPSCARWLNTEMFQKNKRRMDGLKVYCKECRSQKGIERYHKDIEASRKSCRDRMRRWRDKDPVNMEKGRVQVKEYYYKMGREVMGAKMNSWRQTPSGRKALVLQSQRRLARKKTVMNDLTKDDIDFLLMIQEDKCARCGISFSKRPYTLDHIIPISLKGDTTLSNTQLLCRNCNSSKGAKTEMCRVPYENFV